MSEEKRESYWMGTPISQLSKEELLEVIEELGKEIINLRNDRNAWMDVGDSIKYMFNNRIK